MLCYALCRGSRGAQERRREGGTRERGTGRRKSLELLVVRQQELPVQHISTQHLLPLHSIAHYASSCIV